MAVVGVTGHRVLADQEKINHAVDQALHHIQQRFPNQLIRLLTQLAEGSDRVVANHFVKTPGWRVTAILPLPLAEYLSDFSEDSRKIFLDMLHQCDQTIQIPAAETREGAYEHAGVYVADHSDLMICIWDGKQEQGRGGAGAIVQLAREKKLPIVWIHAGNRQAGTMTPTSLG